MDYEKQLFDKCKEQAPKDFASKTMQFIMEKELAETEKSTAKIEYSFFKLGQVCVAASLLLVVLNVFPSPKIVHGQGNSDYPMDKKNIIRTAAEKCDDFIDDVIEQIDFNIFEQKNKEKK